MTDNAPSRPISGDTQVAGTPSIAAPGALYAVDSSTPKQKKPAPELLPPFGRETALYQRRLTKTGEKETIIINRPDRSTYPEQKSVSRSGATPDLARHSLVVNRQKLPVCFARSSLLQPNNTYRLICGIGTRWQ